MDRIWQMLADFNVISVTVRLLLAAVLGGIIGLERGIHGRAAGLRTHLLVCVGAALTALTGLYISQEMNLGGDVARLSAQVVSGIGFLGAGMIMIRNSSVITGLTTAAGMWATAAIGIAVGYGFYTGTLVSAFLCVFSMTVLSLLERTRKNSVSVYTELPDISLVDKAQGILRGFEDSLNYFDILPPKSGIAGHVGLMVLIKSDVHFEVLKQQLLALDDRIVAVCDIKS